MSHYNRVIIGAGLSGLSLADRWCDQGAMPATENVGLIDTDFEAIKNRTFAFWRAPSAKLFRYAPLVENRWEKFRVTPGTSPAKIEPLRFSPFIYEKIAGATFYEHVTPKLKADARFTLIHDSVLAVRETPAGVVITLKSGDEITADEVWSSASVTEPAPVLQHFLGLEIETDDDVFDADVADLMDFRTDPLGQTRFVYLLPYSPRTALVEFTVFSVGLLTDQEYRAALETYLTQRLGLRHYRIGRVEQGVVPMALEIRPRFAGSGLSTKIHPIGAAAGLIKPSTGYSFMRNQVFLDAPVNTKRFCRWRFYIYDRLLLAIIRQSGARLSEILPQLFAANPPVRVFRFLNEESRFSDEIQIFYGLPWAPFLKNLVIEYPFAFALGLTAVIFPAGHLIIPLIGVAVLGIVHGSRDHQLLPHDSRLAFIGKYLLGVALFLGIWWLSPAGSLLLFLALSSEHFGTCQFARARELAGHSLWIKLWGFAWGAFASIGAPLLHWREALPILRSILRSPTALSWVPPSLPLALGLVAGALALVAAAIVDRYELKVTGRARPAFASTVVLTLTFAALPLLPGFLVFFAFWHSVDSIRHQQMPNRLSWKNYFIEALPLTAVSWLGLGVLFWWFGLSWSVFFSAVGAVTLPHAFVMRRFYHKKSLSH